MGKEEVKTVVAVILETGSPDVWVLVSPCFLPDPGPAQHAPYESLWSPLSVVAATAAHSGLILGFWGSGRGQGDCSRPGLGIMELIIICSVLSPQTLLSVKTAEPCPLGPAALSQSPCVPVYLRGMCNAMPINQT